MSRRVGRSVTDQARQHHPCVAQPGQSPRFGSGLSGVRISPHGPLRRQRWIAPTPPKRGSRGSLPRVGPTGLSSNGRAGVLHTPDQGSIPWRPTTARYTSGEVLRPSSGREGFDPPTRGHFCPHQWTWPRDYESPMGRSIRPGGATSRPAR